jgi:hypothetical protein
MYGGGGPQGVNPYGRPPQYGAPGYSGPHGGIGGGGFPQPQPYARGGPMGAPPPHMAPAPARNFAYRPEIIFMSTITRQGDKIHHVQFLKPMLHKSMSTKTRRPSDSRSTRSFA